ncbi:MAG: type II secretion system F family protein [Bacteroidales bacterium]|nr:type II secretion system F family protein [Bacteroidales bacterium]
MGQKKLTDQKKRLFYSQLHVLLRAGMSFASSFSVIVDGAKGREKELYGALFEDVISGHSLWSAMQGRDDFSKLDYGVVRVGEESGNLMAALAFLSDYYQRKETQRRTIVGALSYPAIIMAVAVVVVIFMLTVVVPMFEQVYTRMGGELPSLTRFIIRLSSFLPTVLFIVLGILAVFYCVHRVYRDTDWYQSFCAKLVLAVPVVGSLIKKVQLSRFCRIMNLLVSSDVPLLQSLELVGGILSLYPYKHSVEAVSEKVQTGSLMADAFADYPNLYDKKFLVMMRVGEETNSLDTMLQTLSDDLSEDLNYQIKQLNNMLEPALIIFIGAIVAFVLISMYLPMFKLGMTIQ